MSKSEPYAARFQFSQYRVSVFWLRCGLFLVLASVAAYVFLNGEFRNPMGKEEGAKGSSKTAAMTFPQGAHLEPQTPSFPVDPRNVTLKKALQTARINVSLNNTPFIPALNQVFWPLNVNFFVTQSARDLIQSEKLVLNLNLQNVSAYSALKHIDIQHSELAIVLKDGLVFVTSVDDYQQPQMLRFYDVSPMLRNFKVVEAILEKAEQEERVKNPPSEANTGSYPDEIEDSSTCCYGVEPNLELLETIVNIDEADEYYSLEIHDGVLFARANAKQHRRIEQFLITYNENANTCKGKIVPDLEGATRSPNFNEAWGKKASQSLNKTISEFIVEDLPFNDFVDFLRKRTGLNIAVSRESHIDEIILSIQLLDQNLKEILDWVLEDNQLAMIPYYEAFRIVPKELNEHKEFQFKIYSIEDILYPEGKANSSIDADRLKERIRSATAEYNWEDPASIQIYGGQIICYQTGEIFTKIDRILAVTRANMARKK